MVVEKALGADEPVDMGGNASVSSGAYTSMAVTVESLSGLKGFGTEAAEWGPSVSTFSSEMESSESPSKSLGRTQLGWSLSALTD